jgi:hypothetical protein
MTHTFRCRRSLIHLPSRSLISSSVTTNTVITMDDSIEAPSFVTKPTLSDERREDDDAQSSGDEDEGPDWTKLPYVDILTYYAYIQ